MKGVSKMRFAKRSISILLLALMLWGTVAFAEDVTAQPYASELIAARYIYARDYGGGSIGFTADMSTIGAVDKLGFEYIRIQEKQGSSWVTVKSTSDKYGYNLSMYNYSLSYSEFLAEGFPVQSIEVHYNTVLSCWRYGVAYDHLACFLCWFHIP